MKCVNYYTTRDKGVFWLINICLRVLYTVWLLLGSIQLFKLDNHAVCVKCSYSLIAQHKIIELDSIKT